MSKDEVALLYRVFDTNRDGLLEVGSSWSQKSSATAKSPGGVGMLLMPRDAAASSQRQLATPLCQDGSIALRCMTCALY